MKLFVIKCGGSVLEKMPDSFYEELIDVQKSGQYFPIIVHGGGPAISQLLSQLKIPSRFQNGLRVTSKEVLEVVEMVLNGS
ncbi:MAG: acetylglutamate kinase, partial [Tuberibacillus sp.]